MGRKGQMESEGDRDGAGAQAKGERGKKGKKGGHTMTHIDPKAFIATNCTEDRLEDWENINPMFNRLLGYGATQGEIAMKVCHGEGGVEGIVNFLRWFTQK